MSTYLPNQNRNPQKTPVSPHGGGLSCVAALNILTNYAWPWIAALDKWISDLSECTVQMRVKLCWTGFAFSLTEVRSLRALVIFMSIRGQSPACSSIKCQRLDPFFPGPLTYSGEFVSFLLSPWYRLAQYLAASHTSRRQIMKQFISFCCLLEILILYKWALKAHLGSPNQVLAFK